MKTKYQDSRFIMKKVSTERRYVTALHSFSSALTRVFSWCVNPARYQNVKVSKTLGQTLQPTEPTASWSDSFNILTFRQILLNS